MGDGVSVVFGANGPVGQSLVERLCAAGRRVRAVHRSGDMAAPDGVEVVAADAAERSSAIAAAAGAEVVYACIGVDYTQWPALWPPIVDGLLAATEAAGARLVFADNLYAHGPADGPLRETPAGTAPTTYGKKPALRARLASSMLEAHASGRCPVALVRASDFYGPHVLNAALGDRVFPAIMAGKSAQLLPGVDLPCLRAVRSCSPR